MSKTYKKRRIKNLKFTLHDHCWSYTFINFRQFLPPLHGTKLCDSGMCLKEKAPLRPSLTTMMFWQLCTGLMESNSLVVPSMAWSTSGTQSMVFWCTRLREEGISQVAAAWLTGDRLLILQEGISPHCVIRRMGASYLQEEIADLCVCMMSLNRWVLFQFSSLEGSYDLLI